ncbi:MAG: hypothetical protein HQK65_07525 [Desulfamplus sp.]|nr:hypothetical protein [Desulfamplus sp.]
MTEVKMEYQLSSEGGTMINGLEIGKCLESYSIKIPENLKRHLDKLSNTQKTELKAELLVCMAKACHTAQFEPSEFLKD